MPPDSSDDTISFPAHPWALVVYITNYSTLLLLRLLSALLGRVTHLPRKGLEPLLKDPSPYKAATSYLVCSSMLLGALLGRPRTLAVVKEDGVEKRPISSPALTTPRRRTDATTRSGAMSASVSSGGTHHPYPTSF